MNQRKYVSSLSGFGQLQGQARDYRPSLNSERQTSALPWSDHTTLAANYKLWFPTQKSGVLPKVAQNTFPSIWCIWKHAGRCAYSPVLCACPSPQKGASIILKHVPRVPACQADILTTSLDPFLLNGSKWQTVSVAARNTGSARTHRWQQHPAILLTEGQKIWNLHFSITLNLDSRPKSASCLCSLKTVASRLAVLSVSFLLH